MKERKGQMLLVENVEMPLDFLSPNKVVKTRYAGCGLIRIYPPDMKIDITV